ncbi:MAG: S8 family peptidase [Dehalococcoidia bacterium]
MKLAQPGHTLRHIAITAGAIAALAIIAFAAPAATDATPFAARAQAVAGERVGVILQAAEGTEALIAAIERAGGTVERVYSIISAVQATVPQSTIEQLRAESAVAHISLDAEIVLAGKRDATCDKKGKKKKPDCDDATTDGDGATKDRKTRNKKDKRSGGVNSQQEPATEGPPSVFPAAVGATEVWAAGITGAGIGIAIIDTGINTSDVDFRNRVTGRQSFVRGRATDSSGHGTHVAGVAAGDGTNSDGRYMGIAPGANLIAVKVGNLDGVRIGDAIAGLEWVLANASRYNIRVANLSFTSTVPESYLVSPLDAAVEQLWLSGIVVVVSAGNRGSEQFAADHPPANDPFVITVGAASDNGTVDDDDDYLKAWSSRGLSRDGFVKPEIVAPGSRLVASVGDRRAELIKLYPENVVEDVYFRMGGTSAAAPVVSGVVALMLQANPGLTPDEVKARIIAGADELLKQRGSGPAPGSDAPQIDAMDAVFGGPAGLANQDIQYSLWIDPASGSIQNEPGSLDSITWDSITWDSITWDSITWDSIVQE